MSQAGQKDTKNQWLQQKRRFYKMEQKQSNKSRWVAGAVAAAAVVAIVLTGTFAYINNDQHKTNALTSGQAVSVTLNNDFKPPTNWTPGETVNNDISVTNLATSDAPVFVRIQFKEYMEFAPLTLITDSDGNPLLFATYASGDKIGQYMLWNDKPASYNYTIKNVDGVDYCLTQNAELKDGIYGKPMYETGAVDVFGTVDKAPYPDQPQDKANDPECNYNVTQWDGTTRLADIKDQKGEGTVDISNYISWTLGTDVMSMKDWVDAGCETGHFWVIDTDGWVYWANPLAPGETTAKALDSVTLDSLHGNVTNLKYYLHTDMESCTGDEFASNNQWDGATANAQTLILALLGDKSIPNPYNLFGHDGNLLVAPVTGYAGLYEVLTDTGAHASPKLYILDPDGSIAGSNALNGDEKEVDADFVDRLQTTYYEGLPSGDADHVALVNGFAGVVDENDYLLIDEVNFPDATLRGIIENGFDTAEYHEWDGGFTPETDEATYAYKNMNQQAADINGDLKLSPVELDTPTSSYMNNVRVVGTTQTNYIVPADKMTSLTGLEYFPNIDTIQAIRFSIESFTPADFPKLKVLALHTDGAMHSLDLTNNPALEVLANNNSSISSINLSKNTNLKFLVFNNSPNLTGLDLSACTDLEYAYCHTDPKMETLNVNGLTKLKVLYANDDGITTLDLTGLTSLETVHLNQSYALTTTSYGPLASLTVNNLPALKALNVQNQGLTDLDVSGCTSLQTLYAYCANTAAIYGVLGHGPMKSLNVSGCTALSILNVYCQSLTALNLDNLPALGAVTAYNNDLSSVSLANDPGLWLLDVGNDKGYGWYPTILNHFTTLDISQTGITSNSTTLRIQNLGALQIICPTTGYVFDNATYHTDGTTPTVTP